MTTKDLSFVKRVSGPFPHVATGAITLMLASTLAGCSPTAPPESTTAPADLGAEIGAMTLTSADFVDGDNLDARFSASAFDGQCTGDNLNPQLAWEGAPEGTVTFAITMSDASFQDWSHWVHVNIPADVTAIETGASATLAGAAGVTNAGNAGYFGPCPPNPGHEYVFTVWALDTELEWGDSFRVADFTALSRDHILAVGRITGVFGPVE